MASRREVIGAGLLAAAPFAAAAVPAWAGGAEPALWRAIHDQRFAAARAFAAKARGRGWMVRAIAGDVTDLWFDELAPRWKEGPAAIAGVTTAASLFCLDLLARDAGMRTLARSEGEDGLVAWLIGPPRVGGRA